MSNFQQQSDIHEHNTRTKTLIRKNFLKLRISQHGLEFYAVNLYNRPPGGLKNMSIRHFRTNVENMLTNRVIYSMKEFYDINLYDSDFCKYFECSRCFSMYLYIFTMSNFYIYLSTFNVFHIYLSYELYTFIQFHIFFSDCNSCVFFRIFYFFSRVTCESNCDIFANLQ